VKEVLSEDAVRDSVRWSKSLSVLAGIKARSEKAYCSKGNALLKLKKQFVASILLRGSSFFLLWQKSTRNN
jgi:hypothetical protein